MSSHDLIFRLDFEKWKPKGAILEIGSQRHGGEGSSFQLLKLAEKLAIAFSAVDFSEKTFIAARRSVKDYAFLADGVAFLRGYESKISILYLDNYDIANSEEHFVDLKRRIGSVYYEKGFDDSSIIAQNLASALVHLQQIEVGLPKLTESCVVAIDDTFYRGDGRCWRGKGALVVPYLITAGFQILETSKSGVLLGRSIPGRN